MTDLLRQLSNFTANLNPGEKPQEITNNGVSYYVFGDYAYPKDTPTQLTVYNKPNEYYELEALVFFYMNKDDNHTNYVKKAAANNIRAVTRPDRRELLEFLKGDRPEIPSNFDAHLPPRPPIPVSRLLNDVSEPDRKKQKLDPSAERGQRLESLLNKDKDDEPDVTQLRSLNENLTADKIAALKKKRMNNKKRNIAATAESEMDIEVDLGLRTDRDQRLKERVWRTRLNCMESLTKDFSNAFDILKSMKIREDTEARQSSTTTATTTSQKPQQRPKPQQSGYSRYDQEIFNKELNADFNIDVEQSFVGTNLSSFGKMPLPTTADRKPQIPTPVRSQPSSNNAATPPMPRKRTNRTPIIIIPAAGALVSMLNVRDILQDMQFCTMEEKKAQGAKRESEVQVHRKRGDVTIPYRIVENPMKLSNEEWDRVVAVFVMGPAWQFKGWKYNGNPVEIFSHIAGFHLHYDDLKIDPNVAKWNVTLLPISRTKRHLDKARLAKFWDMLDRHIIKNKNHLRY